MSPGEARHRLFASAMPLAAVSWIAMYALPWLLLRRSGTKSLLAVSQNPPVAGLPSLPESLHVIHLPGVRYAVKTFSALVLDKQTIFTTTSVTTTTPGPVNVVAVDLNGANRPDLATANSVSNNVSVLMNTTATGAAAASIAVTDIAVRSYSYASFSMPLRATVPSTSGRAEL